MLDDEDGLCPHCSGLGAYSEFVECGFEVLECKNVICPQCNGEGVSLEISCKTDPRAPHGFLRNASHSEGRYVCECEYWEPE